MALMEAGMDVVRMNFSHGTHEYHRGTIANAREAARRLGRDICIALDTKGPEIRTGNFVDGQEVILELGSRVRVSVNEADHDTGTIEKFYVDYTNLPRVVQVGDLIYIDDGLVSLKIEGIGDDYVDTTVVNSGPVSNHKGVNLPNVNVDLPAVSEKDRGDLTLGVELNVDMVFASFIRKPDDVREIRECLVAANPEVGGRIQIISKIENHEGVQKFDDILMETSGVMVARGDLGIEIPPQKVFLAQKMMISKCNLANKPIIVATQMLESMQKNPRPTRAEVSDVANAVLDGADCVMLSGETAKGKYPLESVQIMASICLEAESAMNPMANFLDMRESVRKPLQTSDSVCCAAALACFEQQARLMIVLTNSGSTGRIAAKFRPPCPIIAVVGESCAFSARQLAITSGVFAVRYDDSAGKLPVDDRVRIGVEFGKTNGYITPGDAAVCVHADVMGKGYANLMKVIFVD